MKFQIIVSLLEITEEGEGGEFGVAKLIEPSLIRAHLDNEDDVAEDGSFEATREEAEHIFNQLTI